MDDLITRQERLEIEMYDTAANEYFARLANGKQSVTAAYRKMVEEYATPLAERIESECASWFLLKAGVRGAARWAPALSTLPSLDVAIFTIMRMGDQPNKVLARDVAQTIGAEIEKVWQYSRSDDSARKALDLIMKRCKERSVAKLSKKINMVLAKSGRWDFETRQMVGAFLVKVAMEETGLWYIRKTRKAKPRGGWRHESWFLWHESALDMLYSLHEVYARTRPEMPYMMVPPKKWGTNETGGYLKLNYPLFKRGKWQEFASNCPRDSEAVQAVDVLGETALKINEFTMETLNWAYQSKRGVGKHLPSQHVEYPAKPKDIETNEESRRQWRADRHVVEAEHQKKMERIRDMLFTLRRAEKIRAEKTPFYIPNQMDFRSRIYPAGSQHIHPQSNDLVKSMLTFSQGVPLGDEGLSWLYRRTASLAGHDKETYTDRENWVQENLEPIIESGLNPTETVEWWSDKDEPWCFLACCREIALALRSGDPANYSSHVSGAVDGVTNALQHYAALGRDAVAAEATGLMPADRPSDMYTRVLEAVRPKVDRIASGDALPMHGDDLERAYQAYERKAQRKCEELLGLAKEWHEIRRNGRNTEPDWYATRKQAIQEAYAPTGDDNLLANMASARYWAPKLENGRKIVKRNSMTYAYGLTEYGAQEQMYEHVAEEETYYRYRHASWLGKLVHNTVPDVVQSAKVYMDWFQECARAVVGEGNPLEWDTPCGVKVYQHYTKFDEYQLKTPLGSVSTWRTSDKPIRLTKKSKNVTASTPNIIHSLDASHLQKTVLAAKRDGITDFQMVHDSYGTHFGNMSRLSKVLREQFVELYTPDRLTAWKDSVENYSGVTLPEPPATGDFDIKQVLKSTYFFH